MIIGQLLEASRKRYDGVCAHDWRADAKYLRVT